MPIRFACPRCQQKLSVAVRRAGTADTCPRCHEPVTIPLSPAEIPVPTEEDSGLALGEMNVDESTAPAAVADHAPAVSEREPALPGPEADRFAGLELIYEPPRIGKQPAAPRREPATIVLPRYVVYLQGALIALAATLGLVIGMILGASFGSRSQNPSPAACLIRGSVTYASGARQLPDAGAMLFFLPPNARPLDEKLAASSLVDSSRVDDVPARAAAIVNQLGGGAVRTDTGGRWEIHLPAAGRYLVLAISNRRTARSAGSDRVQASAVVSIKPFFDRPVELLQGRRYYLAEHSLRDQQELSIELD